MDVHRRDPPAWEAHEDCLTDLLPLHLRPLRLILAAAEYMSFRRAADALQLHQSSVSRGVRNFEDAIGVALFERDTTGVRLTNAGEHFVNQMIPALQQLASAFRTAGAAGRVEIGTVRVGVITTIASGFIRELLLRYSARHPKVKLRIIDGGRRAHIAAIRSRQLDVVFLSGNGEITDCDTAELWRERVHVALAADHPLVGADRLDWPMLRDEHFIVTLCEPGPEVHDYIVRRAASYSDYPLVEHRTCSQEMLMSLVALGQGVTLVTSAWADTARPGLAFRPLSAPEDLAPFSAVWSPDNDNPALRRFLSEARVLAGVSRHRNGRWRTAAGTGGNGAQPAAGPN